MLQLQRSRADHLACLSQRCPSQATLYKSKNSSESEYPVFNERGLMHAAASRETFPSEAQLGQRICKATCHVNCISQKIGRKNACAMLQSASLS